MDLGDVLARLAVELSLNTAAFSTGSRKASKDAAQLGDKMESLRQRVGRTGKAIVGVGLAVAGSAVLGTVANLVKQGLEYASALGEQAQQLGVSTKALQEYRYAATQVGISSDEMDAALAKLTRSIGEAEAGSKTQAEAFAKLGISTRDAGGAIKDAGDLLPEIAEKLKGLHSPAERAALLVDLFGKSGQKLAPLLAGGAAGVNQLRDAARSLGVVLSDEQIQKADETADKLAAIKTVLSARIAGAVADNTTSILSLADALGQLVQVLGDVDRPYQKFVRFQKEFAATGKTIVGLTPGVRAEGQRELDALNGVKPGATPARRAPPTPLRSGGTLLFKPKKNSTYRGGLGPLTTGLGADTANRFGDPGLGVANLAALGVTLENTGKAFDKFAETSNDNEERVGASTVRIAESFAEMAQRTIGSLQSLTSAIKGGGFLDILGAAVGLFTQLAGVGAFGKGLQTRVNGPVSTPPINGYAGGTMSAARGLALVGERGRELVRFRGGERVFPNGQGPGGRVTNNYYTLPSGEFWQRVDGRADGRIVRAAPAMIDGGARVAASRGARAQSRRLA